MKPTQLSYPTPEQLAAAPATPSALSSAKLITQPPRSQLHHLRDGAVVLYKRERSSIWQMRFKLYDHVWHRATTRHMDLGYAKRAAGEIYDRAKFKEELGIPQTTRRFGVAAAQCLLQLEAEIAQGLRPMTNRDYQRVIRKYLVPFFGKYKLTSIDAKLVREFEIWRNQQIGHIRV